MEMKGVEEMEKQKLQKNNTKSEQKWKWRNTK